MTACTTKGNEMVASLLRERTSKEDGLGQLGACVFEEPRAFFERAVQESAAVAPAWRYDYNDTVALGDVHGDFAALLSGLVALNVIDERGRFCMERPTLVVLCGDLLDGAGRCEESQKLGYAREEVDILQFCHALAREARSVNGSCVVHLLGNHEVARVQVWRNYKVYVSPVARQGWGPDADAFFRTTMRDYVARCFPLFVQNRFFVFMHAGLSRKFVRSDPRAPGERLNQMCYDWLVDARGAPPDDLMSSLVLARDMNPSRGEEGASCSEMLVAARAVFPGARFFVLGHTVQQDLRPFCHGAIFQIDFALSRAFACMGATRETGGLFIKQDNPHTVYVDHIRCRRSQKRFTLSTLRD